MSKPGTCHLFSVVAAWFQELKSKERPIQTEDQHQKQQERPILAQVWNPRLNWSVQFINLKVQLKFSEVKTFLPFLTSQKRTRHFPGVDSITQRTQNQNQSSRTQLSLFFWELLDYCTVWIVKKGCHNHQSANQSDKSEDFTQRSRPKTGSRNQARICQLYNELKVKCALL